MQRNLDFIVNLQRAKTQKRKEYEHRRVWIVAVAHPTAPKTEEEIIEKKLLRCDTMTEDEMRKLITKRTPLTANHGAIDPERGTYIIPPKNVGWIEKATIDEIGRLIVMGYCEGSWYTAGMRKKILNGEFRDVSLTVKCQVVDGKYSFSIDSIALVAEGRKKGTHILYASNGKKEMSRLPKSSFTNLNMMVEDAKREASEQRKRYEIKNKGKNLKTSIYISTCVCYQMKCSRLRVTR